ncbi:hypothetical protein BgiBS90_033449 [Biomphalaria glabrata]|nr:hypothetical protein BgiBS90_033449 [Biomphalaria glabrata]
MQLIDKIEMQLIDQKEMQLIDKIEMPCRRRRNKGHSFKFQLNNEPVQRWANHNGGPPPLNGFNVFT